jgi:hypothetical protein
MRDVEADDGRTRAIIAAIDRLTAAVLLTHGVADPLAELAYLRKQIPDVPDEPEDAS